MFDAFERPHVIGVRVAALQPSVRAEFDHDRRDFEQRVRGAVEAAGLDVDDHGQELAEAPAHEWRRRSTAPTGRGWQELVHQATSCQSIGFVGAHRHEDAVFLRSSHRVVSRRTPRAAARAGCARHCAAARRSPRRSRTAKPSSLSSLPTDSNASAYSSMPACAENMPAQPQAFSLVCCACGALSVPRKKRGLPLVAAASSASRSGSVLRIGRQ